MLRMAVRAYTGNRFVAGLACFLLTHLAYLGAFSSGLAIGTVPALMVPLLVVMVALLRYLWAGLGRHRGPVLVYSVAIVLMVWQAWGRSLLIPGPGAALAAGGATLFMLSDAILALNRFRRPFPASRLLVMTSYVAAQAMIALSVSTA